MPRKLTIEEMRKIAEERGGECLSEEYVNNRTELRWKCAEGHEWEAAPGSINQGSWCPVCAGNIKLTIGEMRKLAKKRGGECLSREYVNARTKLRWRCTEGHEWEATPASIKQGSWCPHCSGRVPLAIEDMQALAKRRGGECLSEEYVNARTKLRWRCAEGHEWEAAPLSIKHGSWCPHCSGNARLTMGEMREIAKQRGGECLSGKYVNAHTKLRWRCAEGHEWEATPDNIKNGKWCPYCAGNVKYTLEDMREIAKQRGGECLSSEYFNVNTKLRWRCSRGHEWETIPENIINGSWCPNCVGKAKLTIEDMRKLAKKRGGECLSEEYVNARTKLRWRCKKGHEWGATPDNIKRGQWCPQCAGNARLTIEDMRKLAKKKGGECLSKEYVNIKTKLRWRCKKGHEWEATPDNIKQGSWCPQCRKGSKRPRGCVFYPGIREPIYGDEGEIIGCVEHYEYYRKERTRKKTCSECGGPGKKPG